ncbi:MAG: MAPEG family protein [Sphingobium sp.]
MLLPVTLTLAALCAFINFWLALRCGRARMPAKVLHGDGGDPLLVKRMRAHANFTEYTPIVLILCALVELAVGASIWLWIAAAVYALARIAHGFGMDADKPTVWRAGGILITMVVMLGLAVAALVVAWQATREVPAPPALAASV